MIPVTKPFLPPKEEYEQLLQGIWQRNWLTNNGPLVNELELKLKKELNIEHILFLSNGTIALQIAIKALQLQGEIITTPFSYVATTSSIVWENCKPVFVDIDEESFNIDASKIEAAITKNTKAILATHVFGNPCDVDTIQAIADKHKLKVIYDAAHAFGVTYKENSIYNYGDISTTSFHATKLFHTIEGGAVFTKDPELLRKMALLRNFGHTSSTSFDGVGINAKNSEFHAAMGLCNLKYIDEILNRRYEISKLYSKKLKNLELKRPKLLDNIKYNYAYYPVVFKNEDDVMKILENLEKLNIFCRRYFYPSLSKLNYVKHTPTPVSDDISTRILCLPLYHTLSDSEVDMICRLIKRTLKYSL